MAAPVAPAANPAAFGVVMLKATLGLEESGSCSYNVTSILMLWMLREVLPASPGGDLKREGGSLECVGGDGSLDPCAADDDADTEFDDSSSCGLLSNDGCAPTDFGNAISC